MGVAVIYPLFLALLIGLIVFAATRSAIAVRTPGSWIAIAVAGWLAALSFTTIRPGSGLGVRLNLIPVIVDGPGSAADAVRNLFVFVPFGMLLAVVGWRLLAALGAAVAISLAIETTQYLTNWGRTADINDVLTNGLGAVIGWAIAFAIRRAFTRPRSAQPVETPPAVY